MSEFKIKVGLELEDELKDIIDSYIKETAFQMGLDYKLEKISLREDDTLVVRIPTDEDGDVYLDFETIQAYFKAIKENVKCKNVIALPDVLTFKIIDTDYLELIAEGINEELKNRKPIK